MQVMRVKNRVYNEGRLVSHAEYAVVDGEHVLARLVFNRRSWVAVECGSSIGFGKPVSPMNLVLLRDVKRWALEKWNMK